jgi:protein ImuB
VAPLRPGLLAVKAPGRFYGGEEYAAATIAEKLVEIGIWDVRIGIADDLFTAEQAARTAEVQGWRVIAPDGSAEFLCDLPVEVLEDADLVGLLRRLGLRLLGDLAGLPAADVLTRFGPFAARVHRLLQDRRTDERPLATRTPPPELAAEVVFEPPLDSTEAVCFSVRRTAEELVARLAARELVGTVVRVQAHTDRDTTCTRSWAHSRWFAAADLVDRVHWQLESAARAGQLDGPVARVRFEPETVEPAGAHAEALWGSGTDDRVERGVARVQAMLGYDAACRPVRQGGRAPADRQALVPWGEKADWHRGLRPLDLPWPGSVPSPAPTRVFPAPTPGKRNDVPMRRSDPIARLTWSTSAPTSSQTFATSFMNEMRVASIAFAAYLHNSALAQSITMIGAPVRVNGR